MGARFSVFLQVLIEYMRENASKRPEKSWRDQSELYRGSSPAFLTSEVRERARKRKRERERSRAEKWPLVPIFGALAKGILSLNNEQAENEPSKDPQIPNAKEENAEKKDKRPVKLVISFKRLFCICEIRIIIPPYVYPPIFSSHLPPPPPPPPPSLLRSWVRDAGVDRLPPSLRLHACTLPLIRHPAQDRLRCAREHAASTDREEDDADHPLHPQRGRPRPACSRLHEIFFFNNLFLFRSLFPHFDFHHFIIIITLAIIIILLK